MRVIEQIKENFAKRKLNKLTAIKSNRTIKTSNFQQAENVGIIYQTKDENDYKKVIKLINYLKGEFGIRNVKAIVYYPVKEDPQFLLSKVSLSFFTKKDINFSLQPNSIEVTNFIKEPFDILIDLTANNITPLKYITLQSKAHLKIGRYKEENEPYYDVMISEKVDNDFEEFVNHIVQYLSLLKNA